MTTINFQRTGGQMGQEIDLNLDLNQLPADESQELQRLILEADFFNIPQTLTGSTSPDEYQYTITVDAGNSHHTVQTSDSTAPESLRPLIEKLTTLAKENRSNTQRV